MFAISKSKFHEEKHYSLVEKNLDGDFEYFGITMKPNHYFREINTVTCDYVDSRGVIHEKCFFSQDFLKAKGIKYEP